jgi:predicted helicase
VREILIQHILTEEIFAVVFPGTPFHQDNNIARELYKLEATFFTGNTKFQVLKALEVYYRAIRAAAGQIGSHHEKQTFLKVVYENFYKVYNPKAADRLGVVYTPNEIVRFMIESTDWLCEQHFGRNLIDKDVEILDPAAGTGTFISELLEHFRGQPDRLKHKYLEELHANEVAILPYYVANLNIEATYAAITGEYVEYPNLCFVDTLDNVAGLRRYTGDQVADLFGMGEENIERIKRQNRRKISVVIGNPPYNANQANENDNNKNREYPEIDKRIKDTYIKASTAQKTKLYDMYARFFRWASDRIAENGVVAFISNRSFIDSRTFDGFRAVVAKEFSEIHVVDLGGDVRANPKLSGTKHNVFGIQTGVAIGFLVKRAKAQGCRVFYTRRPELETAEEKLAWLGRAKLGALERSEVRPDAKHNWIDLTDNDFDSLMPVVTKEAKAASKPSHEKAIFKLFSLGISTNRDEWLYGFDEATLIEKTRLILATVDAHAVGSVDFEDSIKWSETLKRRAKAGQREPYEARNIVRAAYRPFVAPFLYQSELMIDRPGLSTTFFPPGAANVAICFSDAGSRTDYAVLAVSGVADLHFGASIDAYQQVALHRFDAAGSQVDNITDWAFKQFKDHYKAEPSSGASRHLLPKGEGKTRAISKQAIFHYVYAVLHDPLYREKYAQNLKREFPRIPFYEDFWRWSEWGSELMALHIGYETVEPWPLQRIDKSGGPGVDAPSPRPSPRRGEGEGEIRVRKEGEIRLAPKAMLKADKDSGSIVLDSETTLAGIPPEAWDYRLGNRSALEWILDQYKEKKPKDPTIREKFNTYRFADHKEKVIDLLARVTRVSVDTQRIVEAMRATPR